MRFDIPILLIAFNRPDTTAKVFQRIKEIQPEKLFIAADGPRSGMDGEKEKCEAVRNLVLKGVDWPCEVKTLFRDQNLGCGLAPSGAISWFFDNVEEGIILEDDTLPDLSFFNFCKEILERYKYDERIMLITGTNLIENFKADDSYIFTKHAGIWGWASWRRAWRYFDFEMNKWSDETLREKIQLVMGEKNYKNYVSSFDQAFNKKLNAWDYQWYFARLVNDGLGIVSYRNLISNIGFGENATHTFDTKSKLLKWKLSSMEFPLKHPQKIESDASYDKQILSLQNRNIYSNYFRKVIGVLQKKWFAGQS